MPMIGDARRLPQGWDVLRGMAGDVVGEPSRSDDEPPGGGADSAASPAPWTSTLPTVWPEALVVALLLCTPAHPIGYPVALVALVRARRIGLADGWPIVPGLPALLIAVAIATVRDLSIVWVALNGR